MEKAQASEIIGWMCDVFRDINPENARIWAEKFLQPSYEECDVRKAISELRPLCNYFDPVRLDTIINRIRRQRAEKIMDYQKQQAKLSDQQIKNEWLAIDTACDAMSDQEFNELAAIAITLLPAWFADRIRGKNLREVKSLKAEVFKLWQTEQAA